MHETMLSEWRRLGEWINASGEEKLTLNHNLRMAVSDYMAARQTQKNNPERRKGLTAGIGINQAGWRLPLNAGYWKATSCFG